MALSRRSRAEPPREWEYGEHDYKIWSRLNPEHDYSFLPISFLLEIADRRKHATTRQLDSARHPYLYLGRRDYIFKSSVTWLENKGFEKLIQNGYLTTKPRRVNTTNLPHDLGACITQATIELGARKFGLDYIPWSKLRAHENMPRERSVSPDPFRIEVNGTHHYFDRPPFILQNKTETIAFFIEYDRNTEDLGGSARITIEKKLRTIDAIWKQRLYKKLFNFDRAMVLFVCTYDEDSPERKDRRMWAIKNKASEVIGNCPFILYHSIRDYERAVNSITPPTFEEPESSKELFNTTSHLLLYPWQRVGHEPFDLKTLKGA